MPFFYSNFMLFYVMTYVLTIHIGKKRDNIVERSKMTLIPQRSRAYYEGND